MFLLFTSGHLMGKDWTVEQPFVLRFERFHLRLFEA